MPISATDLNKAYLAYFGRPVDFTGKTHFANLELADVIKAFDSSAESQALYGSDVAAKVNAIYNNLFNRDAEPAGLLHWSTLIGQGRITAAEAAFKIMEGALGSDVTAVQNKLSASEAFAAELNTTAELLGYSGMAAAAAARAFLKTVDATPASLTAAVAAVAATVATVAASGGPAGQTFTLTTGIDNIVGTGGNDTIGATVTATSAVLGGLDKVDGGAGTDTLNIADTAVAAGAAFALPAGFSISNVENVNVTTNGNIGAAGPGNSFDLSGNAAVASIKGVAAGTVGSFITASATANVDLTVAGAATANVTGGKAVSVIGGTGATNITGKGLTSVTVKNGGAVIIDNLENTVAATTAKGTTLTSVTLDSVNANSAVKGEGLTDITIKGATVLTNTVAVTNAKADHALTLNVDGTGYQVDGTTEVQTIVADAAAKTITVNATGSKSSLALTGSNAATTVNITGAAALKLAPLASATKVDGSAATGNLTLGTLNAATVNVSTGSGNDSLTLSATAKSTVNTGAGNDTVTLASAVAAGSTINLGAGNDKLLVSTGSVAASTATAVTVIDAGEGIDTLAAALINAANAAQFKNFENIDVSATTPTALDIELMTGSTITGLTLTGGTGGATVNNVAAGVGLSVSGSNIGTSTIGVKGAAAGTADSFTTTFAGTAGAAATAAAPDTIAAGTVVTNGVESLNVVSGGTGFVTNTLAVTDSTLKTLTITGDKALALTFVGVNGTNAAAGGAVKLIDGSAATGALNINTTNVTADSAAAGLTVKTGSAKDVITLVQKATVDAGAGDDTIVTAAAGGTLTGGAGNDKFDVAAAVATGITEAAAVLTTITDFAAGDSVKLLTGNTLAGTTLGSKTALDATVTNIDLALAITSLTDVANEVSWFQYGTNTYIVANNNTVGFGAGDLVVKLTGLVDLSNATLNTGTDYLTLA